MCFYSLLLTFYFLIILACLLVIPAQTNPCAKESGKVTLTTTCPDVCSKEENDICILYPREVQCQHARFGNCRTYNVQEQQCQVHCIKLESSLVVEFTSTNNATDAISAPIEYISQLELSPRVTNVLFKRHSYVSIHPKFLSASSYVTTFQVWHTKINGFPEGSLPLKLYYLELAGAGIKNQPGDLPYLSEILYLYIKENDLTEIPKGIFQMKKLKKLAIQDNPIRNVIMTNKEFEFFKSIQQIEIDPIQSPNCPPNTTITTWTQPAIFITGRDILQPEMIHSFCILNDYVRPSSNPQPHSPTDKARDESSNETLSTGSIIGIIIGVIAICGCVLFFIIRYRKEKEPPGSLAEPLDPFQGRRDQNTQQIIACKDLEKNSILIKARLNFDDIIFIKKIASGGFGMVYKAKYHDKIVAVKTMLPDESHMVLSNMSEFSREIEFAIELKHRSVVSTIGVAWSTSYNLCAVVEFMDQGDLHQVLSTTSTLDMSWTNKWSIIVSISEALQYLHSHDPPIIHRDIKSRNILMDSVKGSKLSDFGLSRRRKEDGEEKSMSAGVGTVRWMAPEVLAGENYTEKIDIYGFGLVLYELSTHELPFDQINENESKPNDHMKLACMITKGTNQLSFDSNSPSCIHELSRMCTAYNPEDRPTSAKLVELMHGKLHFELENWLNRDFSDV